MSKSNQGYVQTAALRKGDQSSEDGQLDEFTSTVADKWQGTVADKHDMVMLGRSQVLRRNFSFISILGFSSVLICTWELIFALAFSRPTIEWSHLIVGMPGISSSPSRMEGAVVSLSLLAGTIIQGQIALQNESYQPKQWHGTLLINAVVLFCIIFNTSLAKKLPLIEGFILLLHVIGLFAIVIPLWVLAPRNPANVALLHFNNGGDWQSTGLAFMVGLLTTLISMAGFDCSVHMSEEIKDASNTLPRALLWGVALNAVLGYVVVITLCFTITDPTALLGSTTGFPFIQLFYNVTNSRVGTHIMTTIIVVNIVSAVISEIATASRQIWSFARDDGFPFSDFLKKVSPGWNIPLNAVVVNFVFGVAISLINLGSSVALGAIVSLTLASLLSSYMLSIGCMFLKRIRGEPLPPAALPLGRWGLAINGVALAFLTAFFIFCFFPTTRLVDASTMNWNSAMFGGITMFATTWYLVGGHKKYRPPVDIQNRKL
ncbi:MAG: hypothetical protein Q9206_001371 [Seirophora lacunosa]